MFFSKISINNFKNINNQLTIDFQSAVIDKTVESSFVIKNSNVGILNKLGLLGKNAIGKTNVLKAIKNISFLSDYKYLDFETNNVKIEELKKTIYNIELIDNQHIINYKIENLNEEIKFSTYNSKIYELTISQIREIFKDEKMLFSDITYRDILNIIEKYKNNSKNQKILNTPLWNLLYLFDVPFKKKASNLEITSNYSNEVFNNSLLKRMFKSFKNIKMLSMENSFFTGSAITKLDVNKETLLKFLYENEKIFKNIEKILSNLDSDINNFKLFVDNKNYKITFSKNNLDFFNCASNGTKKLFGLLGYLYYFKNQNSLILFDELDATLNSFVVEQILKLDYFDNNQLLFTFHNSNILNKNFNLLKADQILFMRYIENTNQKEIVSLFDFENYEKYKRNNKLVLNIIDNVFNTEPSIEIKFDLDDKHV